MSQLSGETVVSVYHLAVNNDTATYACTQRYHDEVFHTACGAVGHFTDGGGIGVIGQRGGNTQTFFKHGGQGDYPFPRKVRGEFDCTAIIVAVRSADTDTFYFIDTAICDNQRKKILTYFVYVIFRPFISSRLDGTTCKNSATCVHDTKDGVRSAYVNPHYIGFFHV